MPFKNLPKAANDLWEEVYNDAKARGLSDEKAAKSAWDVVKKKYRKTKEGEWVPLERKLTLLAALGPVKREAEGDKVRFRKMVIPVGTWTDPRDPEWGDPLSVSYSRIQGWINNFKKGHPPRITVPVGHAGFDDALANTGYVEDLVYDPTPVGEFLEGGLYAVFNFTNAEAAQRVEEGSVPAVSVCINTDWMDTKTGEHIGEVIEHVALTQYPHIQGMPGFEKIAAESAVGLLRPYATASNPWDPSQEEFEDQGGISMPDAKELQEQIDALTKKLDAQAKSHKEEMEKANGTIKSLQDAMEGAKTELEARRQESHEARTAVLADRISILASGKVNDGKYGLAAPLPETILLSVQGLSGRKIKLERDGKETEVDLGEELLTFVQQMVTGKGLVPLADATKVANEPRTHGGKTLLERAKERNPNAFK